MNLFEAAKFHTEVTSPALSRLDALQRQDPAVVQKQGLHGWFCMIFGRCWAANLMGGFLKKLLGVLFAVLRGHKQIRIMMETTQQHWAQRRNMTKGQKPASRLRLLTRTASPSAMNVFTDEEFKSRIQTRKMRTQNATTKLQMLKDATTKSQTSVVIFHYPSAPVSWVQPNGGGADLVFQMLVLKWWGNLQTV